MADQIGGLTASEALSWIGTIMGGGSLGAIILAWIGYRRAQAEARQQRAPKLSAEARDAIGCELAERFAAERAAPERLDRIEAALAEHGRATERLFQALGRHHGDMSDKLSRATDRIEARIDRAIDEVRETRRAVDDLRER
ncbi:hypothetical protein RHODGE_RHODGE_02844 [Rhodoplanes serenus]|uniref:Uncharacterized protein n=1 Tax=Rhodoplanes serenus TaxID=200615 RepID=A0A447CWG0_9BRAD|nr:hypothetical protein [Rhodoplanes serenus]VCU09675.1 hypothetical protein RHODGE_RHODGE_02844 [Rhodoplanes serenus]